MLVAIGLWRGNRLAGISSMALAFLGFLGYFYNLKASLVIPRYGLNYVIDSIGMVICVLIVLYLYLNTKVKQSFGVD